MGGDAVKFYGAIGTASDSDSTRLVSYAEAVESAASLLGPAASVSSVASGTNGVGKKSSRLAVGTECGLEGDGSVEIKFDDAQHEATLAELLRRVRQFTNSAAFVSENPRYAEMLFQHHGRRISHIARLLEPAADDDVAGEWESEPTTKRDRTVSAKKRAATVR